MRTGSKYLIPKGTYSRGGVLGWRVFNSILFNWLGRFSFMNLAFTPEGYSLQSGEDSGVGGSIYPISENNKDDPYQ